MCIGDSMDVWPTFDEQADAYAFWIQRRPEQVIVLACGDSAYESQFQQRFPDRTVLTKWDLARGNEHLMSSLSKLTFDEIAAVDYDLLKEANFVMGIGMSSFAYALGVDRRVDRTSRFSLLMQNESSASYFVSMERRAQAKSCIAVPQDLRGATKMVGDARTRILPPMSEFLYAVVP